MPVLALHFGESKVYTLLVQDDFTFATMSFDYVYLPNVYAPYVSEQQFYSEAVTLILKSYGVAKTSIEIIATGFPIVPTISTPYKLALPINELLSKLPDLSATAFFVINNFSFFANGNFASGFPYYSIDQEELFNLPMYNFCDDEFDKTFLNRLLHYHIANLAQATYRLPAPIKGQKSPVEATTLLFTGEQFSVHTRERRSMLMLLILDIMRSPGMYSLKVDDSNML
ncbi:hypothetical protein KAZ57_01010, partial [Patescibacteria group bacterium]|nr:hypothetical protein [Patescibacteria group bacterium]